MRDRVETVLLIIGLLLAIVATSFASWTTYSRIEMRRIMAIDKRHNEQLKEQIKDQQMVLELLKGSRDCWMVMEKIARKGGKNAQRSGVKRKSPK